MWATAFNTVTFILILNYSIFQKTLVSGQIADIIKEKPIVNFDTCSVELNGVNLKGDKGERGPRGYDGEPGTCKCTCPHEQFSIDLGEYESVTADPVVISCQHSDKKDAEIVVREDNPFKVKCETNGNNTYTCLRKTNKLTVNKDNVEDLCFGLGDEPYWLSERSKDHDKVTFGTTGFNSTTFYFGYDMAQLEFLQRHSVFAIQKIRYHCKNSRVMPQNNPEKALKMLTWKEQLVGPVATNLNPFHYVIENDGCTESSDNWNHADIKLVGNFGRLPILDFYIGDTRYKDQKFYIELLDLCFG